MVIDAKEYRVDDDGEHDEVFEGLGLHDTETLQSKAINWLNWNDLWICVHQQSLQFDPFFLLICELIGPLPLFNLFVEVIYDNGDEQVHNEKRHGENVDHIEQTDHW